MNNRIRQSYRVNGPLGEPIYATVNLNIDEQWETIRILK